MKLASCTDAVQRRPQTPPKSKRRHPPPAPSLCYYHCTLGAKSRRSQQPCAWLENERAGSQQRPWRPATSRAFFLYGIKSLEPSLLLMQERKSVRFPLRGWPCGMAMRATQPGPSLVAANCSTIRTFGKRTMTLCFAMKQCKWDIVIAEVSHPLLCAYFLWANSLMVDLKRKRLVDAETYLSSPLREAGTPPLCLSTISEPGNEYGKLLANFPEITTPNFFHHACHAWY